MTDNPVLYDVASGIARITLNRPDRLNALTRDLMLGLRAALDDAAGSEDVRVILLNGAGRGFCAGQDLGERDPRKLDGPLDLEAIQKELYHPVIRTIRQTPKPVVASVNGVAAGAGAGFALAADITLASDAAKFIFSFAKVGLSVDAGLGRALVQSLGVARSTALLMLGGALTGAEAAEAGLIWRCVPAADLAQETESLIASLAAAPRRSLAGIKAAVAAAALPDLDAYLGAEAHAQGQAGSHPDYAEGVLSFLERRPANFA